MTENELSPGAARVGNYKAVFNLRGDNGARTGGLAVDINRGWKGRENMSPPFRRCLTCGLIPRERYDLFMNNFTERTWTLVTIRQAIKELMETYAKYTPEKDAERELQWPAYPLGLPQVRLREQLGKEDVNIPMPTGN